MNINLYWVADRDRYRVWRSDWNGDQFEIVSGLELATIKRVFSQFGIPVLEYHDES